MENKSFTYKNQHVKFIKREFPYGILNFPYYLKTSEAEIFFPNKEEAKEYIDKILAIKD